MIQELFNNGVCQDVPAMYLEKYHQSLVVVKKSQIFTITSIAIIFTLNSPIILHTSAYKGVKR
jgi:hypothetical protein